MDRWLTFCWLLIFSNATLWLKKWYFDSSVIEMCFFALFSNSPLWWKYIYILIQMSQKCASWLHILMLIWNPRPQCINCTPSKNKHTIISLIIWNSSLVIWNSSMVSLTKEKFKLAEVVAWCHQAPTYCLSQCWHRSMWSYGFTRPQWVTWNVATKRSITNLCIYNIQYAI